MVLEVLIAAHPDTFTPAEAAVIAGVSVRDVHHMIDEHILPERFFDSQDSRSFKSQACVFISFYFGAADRLTAQERQRTIALASRVADWSQTKTTVQDEFLTIDFASFSQGVEERLERLRAARDLVVTDPEILSGTPVIRGHACRSMTWPLPWLRAFRWSGFSRRIQASSGSRSNWRRSLPRRIRSVEGRVGASCLRMRG
jgi:hypothetical protein